MPTPEPPKAEEPSPFAPPQVSLPKGGGAIRGLGEKFQTNPANGTGSLSIPLPLTKGRNGFTPALTLDYSSGAGNGPYGLGWTIALPSISRRTDKGVPRFHPFARHAGGMAAADAADDIFLLSGAEDLVPIAEDDGPWIACTQSHGYFVRGYRPRVEGLFARIESWTRTTDGDTHWRTITRDNILTVYGEGPDSRIADPGDPSRVFTWLICRSYDTRGNAIEYEYAAEGADAVDTSRPEERFRTRPANRYPKRIRYTNREPQLLDLSTESARPSHLPRPVTEAADWLFEAIFDYGDEVFTPAPPEDGFRVVEWTGVAPGTRGVRADPFSTFRSGFEIRTYRLCRRILMTHRMPEMLGETQTLVRAVHFEYEEKRNGTRLTEITQSGYRALDAGRYREKSLPALRLHYSSSPLDADGPRTWAVRELPQDSLDNLPAGVMGEGYQWTDLDGEGIAGVLSAQAGAWLYKPNRGDGRFGPLQVVAETPPIEGGRAQLLDLDADGRLEYATLAPGIGGFFDRTSDAGWTPFRPFRSLPIVDFTDPNVRLADLSGDGLADILITDDQAITWHPSLGDGGFGDAIRIRVPWNEDGGPRVLLGQADQSIVIADMSGDGLPDLVRIRNGEVCYWPSLGHGRFGPKITMDGAPCFDDERSFDARRLRLADTDGSGLADVLYAGSDGVRIFVNESGNALSPPRHVAEMVLTDGMSLDVVDLLGRGTACLVWSTALPGLPWRPVRYIDLMCGEKPHLLVRWENQLGAETRLTYASSTEFYLADRAAGRPWATRLPFPVHVVERIETLDRLSDNRFVSHFRYHHGHYDGVEREFRGFGMVEQIDAEYIGALEDATNWDPALRLPPVVTKTWFHTGHYDDERRVSRHYADEYYRDRSQPALLPDTVLPPGLTFEEAREASRALKGSPLRQETYALDGSAVARHPYSVSESNFTVRLLQPRGHRRYAIFHTHARESVGLQYERKLYEIDGEARPDPRVSHQMTLEVDAFGNVLAGVAIGYGRRYPDRSPLLEAADRAMQTQVLVTCTERSYTRPVSLPDAFRAPVPVTTRTFEIGNVRPEKRHRGAAALFGLDEMRAIVAASRGAGREVPFADWRGESRPGRGPYRRVLDSQRTRYRANRLDTLLPAGVVESLELPGEHYTLTFPSGLIGPIFGERAGEVTRLLLEAGGYVDLDADGNLWRPSGRVFYSPTEVPADEELADAVRNFFLPRRARNAFGAETRSDFDEYRLGVIGVTDALGSRNTFDFDYRVLAPYRAIDINGNRTEVAFDTLGFVAGTASMGKPGERLGDSLEGFEADLSEAAIEEYLEQPVARAAALVGRAGTRFIYDLHAFARRGGPTVSAALRRETHDADLAEGQIPAIQHGLTYSDGFGRDIQKKAQAEPGLVDGHFVEYRWVGTGWTVFNNKGDPVRQYEPFFTDTHRFEFDTRRGVSPTLVYDPLGRVIATLRPNRTYTKMVYEPWRQETWDENDTSRLHAHTDPDIGPMVRRLPEASAPSWYDERIDGAAGADERTAAIEAAVHAGTPAEVFSDSLGRPFLTVARNRFRRDDTVVEEAQVSRVFLDIEGDPREMEDALGRIIMRYENDLSGAQIYRRNPDSGDRWMLKDAAGDPFVAFDGFGRRIRTSYDPLRRQTGTYVREPGGTERLAERTVYGEERPDATRLNLRGRPAQLFDAAGVVTNEAYDFKGNLLSTTRQLAATVESEPDWQNTPPLEADVYRSASRYDALNRLQAVTTPDRSVIHAIFNQAGLLDRVELQYRGADTRETIVSGVDYDAKAQRARIGYGNGLSTVHEYDPLTFRLAHTRTARSLDGAILQDLAYTFDPVGNVTRIRDAAQSTIFFDNQAVEAGGQYRYDALYRVIAATGREHAAIGDRIGAGEFDLPPENSPLPSDGQALRAYREQFSYDAVGNLLELLHTAGATRWRRVHEYGAIADGNRLTGSRVGSLHERFDHDVQGNMTAMPHLPAMTWNFKDQLASSRRQAVDAPGRAVTHYVYDGAGQRVRKVVVSETGRRLRERIYLGVFEIEKASEGGTIVERQTLHVNEGRRRVALVESRDAVRTDRYQLCDQLGSTCIEVDERGALLSLEEYYPFGETAYQADPAGSMGRKRYRYTGQERDDENGLYYHGARYYAPWLARWTSCDPKGLDDGPNCYVFVKNNPVRLVDPDGRQGFDTYDIGMGMMWRQMSNEVDAMIEGVMGGHAYVDIASNRVEYEGPKNGVGGMWGGAVRAITFRLAPIEDNATMASLMGMEMGAGVIPFFDSGERLVCGTTVTGQDTSRGWAAFEFGLDVIPFALELRAASAPARVASTEARFMSMETRMMSTTMREESLITRVLDDAVTAERQAVRESRLGVGGVDDWERPRQSGPWVDQATDVRPGGTVSQSCPGSCVSATGEILTGGAVTEERLLSQLGEWSQPDALARELNAIEGSERWVGGYFGSGEDAVRAANRGQMGATVYSPGAKSQHMVAIEPAGPGKYAVQDPLPGMCYQVDESWIHQFVTGGVWPKF